MRDRGVRVLTNAGGVNPRVCGEAVRAMLARAGAGQVKVAVVTGDDLAELDDAGLDAALAASAQQSKAMWRIRDSITEAQKSEGGSIKHDVSVPVSSVAEFIAEASSAVTKSIPGIRPVTFGHVGDGNFHLTLLVDMDDPVEVKTTIDADLTWGNVHAWFKVFSNVLLQAGFSERAIMAGGAQLAFNEWRSDEDMRSVAKEYDLVMAEHATEPEESDD